jgi:predicted TPR repeat methyltransferase
LNTANVAAGDGWYCGETSELRVSQSLPPAYFEQMFASNPDPWDFETSVYEAAKFEASIAALDGRAYASALEVGCANGVLTQQLAPRCKNLLSIDVSDSALASARERNRAASHVKFCNMVFPKQTPEARFDLIVMSEVVYYWSAADIAAGGAWIAGNLEPGGDLLLVHWTGGTDYPQTGHGAVSLMREVLPNMTVIRATRQEKYRLDLWRRS